MTAGFSSTSFWWIASACAALGLRLRRLALLQQQVAEIAPDERHGSAEAVTAGFSSASFCQIASAVR